MVGHFVLCEVHRSAAVDPKGSESGPSSEYFVAVTGWALR